MRTLSSPAEKSTNRLRLAGPLAAVRRGLEGPAAPPAVAALSFLAVAIRRQIVQPDWEPGGADWDSWYASALWWQGHVPFPGSRWPAFGALAALVDVLTPGPLHVAAQLLSLACLGVATGAVFAWTRRLAGPAAGLAAAGCTLLFPLHLDMFRWVSGYPLWAAAAAVVVAALPAAWVDDRPRNWALVGAGIGMVLAVIEKGLFIGGASLVLALALAGLRGPGRVRRLGALLAPIALLAAAQALFPLPLMSLQAQIAVVSAAPGAGGAAPPPNVDTLRLPGYVFGQSMSPMWLLDLAQRGAAAAGSPAATSQRWGFGSLAGIPVTEAMFVAMGIGAAAAVIQGVRRWRQGGLVAIAALLAVAAGLAPVVLSTFNLRFMLPGTVWLAALPLVLLGLVPERARAVAAAAAFVTLVAWPDGPWQQAEAWQQVSLSGHESRAASLWIDLHRRWPDARIHVQSPAMGGVLVLDGRGGWPLRSDLTSEDGAVEPGDYLLLVVPPASQPKAGDPAQTVVLSPLVAGRTVLGVWAAEGPHPALALVGPVEGGG